MSTSLREQTPDHVVEKVLRRVEVAKIARKLQDRLALASYKAQNGLDNLSFNLLEAHVEESIKRKRPGSSVDISSDGSSSPGPQMFSSTLGSSPVTAPFFSDEIQGSKRSQGHRKRRVHQPAFAPLAFNSNPRKRTRANSTVIPNIESSQTSWKASHHLAASSPVYRQHRNRSYQANQSFMSDMPDSASFDFGSDDDEHNPRRHSFAMQASNFRSSPPRTPPPTKARSLRNRKNAAGEEGADLLLYLATSPSPANAAIRSRIIFPPTTPPSNPGVLPSSVMTTPGAAPLGYGLSTPNQNFNFADFVNVTPSPAQGAFGCRTPAMAKTPLAAKEARRRLNFDSLVPPGGSPNMGAAGRGASGKETGLGMELGGELVSP